MFHLLDTKLVGGSSYREGRVEVFHSGAWGTVCHNDWGMDDAQVLCRSMGYGDAQSATSGSSNSYGPGSGNIAFDYVRCSGSESSFFDCPNSRYLIHNNCDHTKDAGISCSGKMRSNYSSLKYTKNIMFIQIPK